MTWHVIRACQVGTLDLPPPALVIWLRRFISYATTKKAIYEALDFDAPMFAACIELIHSTGSRCSSVPRTGKTPAIKGDGDSVPTA